MGQIVQYPRGYGEVRRWTVEVLRMIDDDFGEYQLRSPNLLGEFLATKEGQAYGEPTTHDSQLIKQLTS